MYSNLDDNSDGSVDDDAYYYLCDKCDEQETDYISYMDHRKLAHSVFLKENTIIHPYLEPNVNDPDFYCCSCEASYLTRREYREHLREIHHMILMVLADEIRSLTNTNTADILPDPDDINFYCRVCQVSYRTLQKYRTHLKHFHNMILTPFKGKMKDALLNVDDPNFHCSACDITHKTKFAYHSHLRNRHVPHTAGPNANPTIKPNLNDHNNYCCSCDMQFLCRKWYDNHLKTRHGVKFRNGTILPDWNDPNNYCQSCETLFSNINAYQGHCRYIHKMNPQGASEETKKVDTTLPDPNDPNFYCGVCNKSNSCRSYHRYHCRAVHSMTLSSLYVGPNANPNLLPDPLDPNTYCKTCDKSFKKRHVYTMHLRRVHSMNLSSLKSQTKDPSRKKGCKATKPTENSYYCETCGKTLSKYISYRKHVVLVHQLDPPPPRTQAQMHQLKPDEDNSRIPVQPDMNDPNSYCRTCDFKYSSRYSYRAHLVNVHSMKLEYLKKLTPGQPNFYCMDCEKTTRESYKRHRYHCKSSSQIKTFYKKSVVPYPDLVIDEKHPEFYCAQCDKKLAHKSSFREHLKKTHNLQKPSHS